MHMAGRQEGLSDNSWICLYRLKKNDIYAIMTALPPVVHKPDKQMCPFCVAQGVELEYVTQET